MNYSDQIEAIESSTDFITDFCFFIEQTVLKEDSKNLMEYLKSFKQLWNRLSNDADREEIARFITLLKLNQKLENAPMAFFSVMEPSTDRNEMLYDLITSEFNLAALLKWIHLSGTQSFYSDTDSKSTLFDLSKSIQWNQFSNFWKGDIESSYKELALQAKRHEEEREKAEMPKFADVNTIQHLLLYLPEYYSDSAISKRDIAKKLQLLALAGDYVLPIDFCLALDRIGYDEDLDEVISELVRKQYGNMRKLEGLSKIMIDGSGSMNHKVVFDIKGKRYGVSRSRMACWFAYLMAIMAEKLEIVHAISTGRKHMLHPAQFDDAITIGEFVKMNEFSALRKNNPFGDDMGDGIYTASSLRILEKGGDSPSTVKTLFVFSDSGDQDYAAFPNGPAIRVAEFMFNVNVGHGYNLDYVHKDEQWDSYINGYSNYLLEYVFLKMGVCNPLFKAAEFSGSDYRFSF